MATERTSSTPAFPIVCLGGSAGGLDAYKKILQILPPDTGLAVVVVNHARRAQTLLPEILRHNTKMPVHVITSGLRLAQNQIFIIPGNHDLTVTNGVFQLHPLSKPIGWPDVITLFLNSLAQEWKGPIIGVILSGMDSDGTAALRAFKAVGGITMAQDLATAERQDMPRHAIDSGYVDFVLSPEAIAQELIRIAQKQKSP